jgi:DNA-binding CsgD family transcriptional regulator
MATSVIRAGATSPELSEIAEMSAAGNYLGAAERCRAAITQASGNEEEPGLAVALEELSYVLRPTRGDYPAPPFSDLLSVTSRLAADAALGPGARAQLLAGQARYAAWQGPTAGLPLARVALAAADDAGDQRARFIALLALHYGLEDPDAFAERRFVSAALLTAAQQSGDTEQRTIAHWRCMIDAWTAADSAGYDLHLTRFHSSAKALGDRHWEAMSASARAARALHEGLYHEAREAAALAETSGIPAAVDAAAIQFSVAAVDQSSERALDPRHSTRQAANRAIYSPQRIGFAFLLMSSGRLAEARAEIDLAPLEMLPRDASYLTALCLSADLYTHLGFDAAAVDRVYDRLLPNAGRMAILGDGTACFGPVDLYLGCIAAHRGDDVDTSRHIEAGYVLAARMRGRPWLARMTRDRVAASAESEEQRARWAQETLELAEELGMRKVAASARDLLRPGAPQAGPREPEARLGKSLTPRESEILALLEEGETASAIAHSLILSTRTVQKHVEHIYEKLGVQTRYQLIANAGSNDTNMPGV